MGWDQEWRPKRCCQVTSHVSLRPPPPFLTLLHRWTNRRSNVLCFSPPRINKDRIGGASIRLQFGNDENWTRALRHVLLTWVLLYTSHPVLFIFSSLTLLFSSVFLHLAPNLLTITLIWIHSTSQTQDSSFLDRQEHVWWQSLNYISVVKSLISTLLLPFCFSLFPTTSFVSVSFRHQSVILLSFSHISKLSFMSNPEDNYFEENISLVHLLISDRIANLKSQDCSNANALLGQWLHQTRLS